MPTLDCEPSCEIITLGGSGSSAGSGGSAGGKNVRSDWVNLGGTLIHQQCWGIWPSLVAESLKSPPAMQETGFDPWVRKIPWRREWLPTPVLLPDPWRATVHWVAKSQTQLSHRHFWVFTFIGETLGDYANTLFLLKLLPANFSRILPAAVIPVVSNGEFLFSSFFLHLLSGILL